MLSNAVNITPNPDVQETLSSDNTRGTDESTKNAGLIDADSVNQILIILLLVVIMTSIASLAGAMEEKTVCLSDSSVAEVSLEYHRFKFFLHPDLVQGISNEKLSSRLTLYVEDLNTIFSKQTIRRFLFDPEEDIIITEEKPHTDSAGVLPEHDFEIWAHVQLTAYPIYGTCGGYMGIDESGAGVAAGLYWDAVYDRSTLEDDSGELQQYWRQINNMAHEIEHVFGAGISEYYNLTMVRDATCIDPIQDINISTNSLDDPYWSQHLDYFTDPLLTNIWNQARVGAPTSYEELMELTRFADVTAAIINDPCRQSTSNSIPDLLHTRVSVCERGAQVPVQSANIKIWKVRSFSPYDNELMVDGTTDSDGLLEFWWNGTFNNYNHLILIKVYPPDERKPKVLWFSIFDAQEEKMVHGNDTLDIAVTIAATQYPEINVKQGQKDIPDDTGSYNFGDVNLGSSSTVIFTLENIGNETFELTGSPKVEIWGERPNDFTVTKDPGTPVNALGETAFILSFTPSESGVLSANVSISNNDSDEDPYDFVIFGTGVSELTQTQNTDYSNDGKNILNSWTVNEVGSDLSF